MKWIYGKKSACLENPCKIRISKKCWTLYKTAFLQGSCTFLEVAYVKVLLHIMGQHKKWTNCISVQCIAARIRMISPLGKSTFTPIAYQLRLQWLKGVGSSISNYTIFQIFFFDQDSLSALFIHLY